MSNIGLAMTAPHFQWVSPLGAALGQCLGSDSNSSRLATRYHPVSRHEINQAAKRHLAVGWHTGRHKSPLCV
jgi:hypothetical protein